VTLPFADLAQCSAQLLAPGGRLFVVLPVQEAQLFVGEAAAAGLALTRCTQVCCLVLWWAGPGGGGGGGGLAQSVYGRGPGGGWFGVLLVGEATAAGLVLTRCTQVCCLVMWLAGPRVCVCVC
jgi:hypothetical protein